MILPGGGKHESGLEIWLGKYFNIMAFVRTIGVIVFVILALMDTLN